MIEGYWLEIDEDEKADILKTVKTISGEEFLEETADVRRFYAVVYEGWRAYRIRLAKQRVIKRHQAGRRQGIPEGAYCIVLVSSSSSGPRKMISMKNESQFIYAVNSALRLRLTKETVVDYLVFFGQVVQSNGSPFFFITNTAQIAKGGGLTDEVAERLQSAVSLLARITESGALSLKVREKAYPILGRVFEVTIPTVFGGGLFSSSLRISEAGYPEMTNDEPMTIQGLEELNPIRFYYHIDNSEPVVASLVSANAKMTRREKLITMPMIVEKVVGVISFPVFAIFGLILFEFGTRDRIIRDFFAKIPEVGVLNWFCLLFGFVMVAAVLLRFGFVELLRLQSKLVPGRMSIIFGQVKANIRSLRNAGWIVFVLATFFEFVLIPLQGAILLAYGGFNVFTNTSWSFIQTSAIVMSSFPALPWVGEVLFGIPAFDFDTAPAAIQVVGWLFAVFFGTIVIGVLSRMALMGLTKD